MDRNTLNTLKNACRAVALRKESVDRNSVLPEYARLAVVALRKESVDRNTARTTCKWG